MDVEKLLKSGLINHSKLAEKLYPTSRPRQTLFTNLKKGLSEPDKEKIIKIFSENT